MFVYTRRSIADHCREFTRLHVVDEVLPYCHFHKSILLYGNLGWNCAQTNCNVMFYVRVYVQRKRDKYVFCVKVDLYIFNDFIIYNSLLYICFSYNIFVLAKIYLFSYNILVLLQYTCFSYNILVLATIYLF